MKQYLELLQKCYDGTVKTDRTGVGTTSIFGPQMRFNLAEGFPLVTTKKIHWKSVVAELLWLLSGSTNIKPLVDQGVNIWSDWPLAAYNKLHPRNFTMAEFTARIKEDKVFAKHWGELGPVYGKQWRAWGAKEGVEHSGTDQIAQMIALLKGDPDSRRMVVSAWNVHDLPAMALSPCHCLFQFYTEPLTPEERIKTVGSDFLTTQLTGHPDKAVISYLDTLNAPRYRLSCQLYQRSADIFLGVPFNIASYALLTQMVAQVVNMVPGGFIWTGGDTHLYASHRTQAEEQLKRTPKELPKVYLNADIKDLFAFTPDDIKLEGYSPDASIKAPVAV